MPRALLALSLSLMVLLAGCSQAGTAVTPTIPTPSHMQWSSPPPMTIDLSKTYFATIDTTLGTFKIQLFATESPVTVNNFVFLSQQGYYTVREDLAHKGIRGHGAAFSVVKGSVLYGFSEPLPAPVKLQIFERSIAH